METFDVLSLSPIFLEKIITKLEWKSYVRLQKSCKLMRDFIRDNKNIKGIFVEERAIAHHFDNNCGDLFRYRKKMEALVGVRLSHFQVPHATKMNGRYNRFKELRFTAKTLLMHSFYHPKAGPTCTKEECARLLKTLQPAKVFLGSRGSDRFKALQDFPQIESYIYVGADDAMNVAKELVTHVRNGNIKIDDRTPRDEIFKLIDSFIKLLQAKLPLRNLDHFQLSVMWLGKAPEIDVMTEKFQAYQPTPTAEEDWGITVNYVLRCMLGRNVYCEIKVFDSSVRIHYDRTMWSE